MKPLVIGLGNPLRGDDAAGLEAARIIRERAPQAEVVTCEREPSDLIYLWEGASLAVVIDAVVGVPPGTVHRLEVEEGGGPAPGWPPSRTASTHALDLPQIIELGRSLGRMPRRLVVLGIAGQAFEAGAPMSDAARAGVDAAVPAILRELGSGSGPATSRGSSTWP